MSYCEETFKYTDKELLEKILNENYKFPITSSKSNLQNKQLDYRILMLMTFMSNRQTESDFTETGTEELWRYLYRNKLKHYQSLVENMSKTKLNTIFKTIKKMEKLDCKVINVRKTEANEIVYDINYTNNGREYITIETKIMEALIHSFNSNAIKVYVLLKYMCRNGRRKISRNWIIEQIGLSSNSGLNYTLITNITNELHLGKYIVKQTVPSIDGKTVTYYEVNSFDKWKSEREKELVK